MWRRESILYAPSPRPTYALSLLVPSCLLSISEVASPGPGCSVPFPPPGRVWLKVTAVIPYPLPRGCRCRTILSAAGFVFHSLLFLGILCSIKPSACNTAGRAPSCSSRLLFLSASASCLLRTVPCPSCSLLCPYNVKLLKSRGTAGVEVQASPFVSGPFLSQAPAKGCKQCPPCS